jgi:uncharacterized protein
MASKALLRRVKTYNWTTVCYPVHRMKLQPDKSTVQAISGYGTDWIAIDGEAISHSLLIGSDGTRRDWQGTRFSELTAAHFAQLAELDTELVVFGSGAQLRFPPTAWLAPLMARRIGLETMDTMAACRTYNILAGEGRKVVAALLLPGAPL